MRDTIPTDFSELSQQASERRARTLVELVIDVLNSWDEPGGDSTRSSFQAAESGTIARRRDDGW